MKRNLEKARRKAEARVAYAVILDKKYEKLKTLLESKGVDKSKEEIIKLIKEDELIHKNPPKNYEPDSGILNVREAMKNSKGLK